MRQMFATPMKARKKAKSQVSAAAKEQTPTKVATAKQAAQPADPIKRAFKNSEGSSSANPINVLQVRKKRKISPTLVQPTATPPSASAGPHASVDAPTTSTQPANVPASSTSSAVGAVVDLSGSSSTDAAPAAQPTETQAAQDHTPAGTFDDPLDI
eukprot:jgi/Phyca11/507615/fgenesh2_kg.PHYCAscaffold_29_\